MSKKVTKKVLPDVERRSNHNCNRCSYKDKCPYTDKQDCMKYNNNLIKESL